MQRTQKGNFDENQFDPSEPEVHNADFCPPPVTKGVREPKERKACWKEAMVS
jgi:hypothetical protein